MKTKNNKPTLDIELELKNQGYQYIIGVDEAGRGPLAGPVVTAAVNIPEGFDTSGINDSKKLSSKNRELFYNKIIEGCDYHIYQIDHATIDAVNILEATMMAMRWAIMGVPKADYALIDGNRMPQFLDLPAKCVVKGDSKSMSIAAASILAKVTRDRIMIGLHEKLPVYGFDKHKGYGTKLHREMIKLYGPSVYHRKSFRGVKEYVLH
jgi:ribonuclease HII